MLPFLSILYTKAFAALIPCQDGTTADSSIGCAQTPPNVIDPQSDVGESIFQIAHGLSLYVAIAATVGIILSGIQYALARGDEEKIQQAKQNLFWSLVGLIISGVAYMVVNGLAEWLS